jgi:metal-responsive CopG/Arc/MetJ family transcriptional regulator
MATQTEKITISLPRDLIQLADELAKEKRVSRSKVVSLCLRELADRRLLMQMAEGYIDMAKENRQFAEQAMNLANEVLPERQ